MDERWWISIIGLALSIATFFLGRFASHQAAGEKNGYLASDIGYIKAGIDDLKSEVRAIKSELSELNMRVTRVEESTKQAHKRIDQLVNEK